MAEIWRSDRTVERINEGFLQVAHDGQWLFGRVALEDSDDDLSERVRAGYVTVLTTLQKLNYRHPFRIWNYLPDINRADNHGLERYRAFCKGRALAFFEDGNYCHQLLPAGTCVGSHSGRVEIAFLAALSDSIVNIENPRQVPAYRYPETYGPKPPSFARATFLRTSRHGGELFVSGTASVIGHASHHSGDVLAQCQATIDNLTHLFGSENLARFECDGELEPQDLDRIKIYVRHREHMPAVAAFCREQFPNSDQVIVEADICREELLVEIEGVCRVERTREVD